LIEQQEAEKLDSRRESKHCKWANNKIRNDEKRRLKKTRAFCRLGVCSVSSVQEETGGLFLRSLLDAEQAGIADIGDDDVTQEVLFMMIAGIETSGLTMCYTMLMLGMHPHIQVRGLSVDHAVPWRKYFLIRLH
jgi:cytochrome P450